jgi:ABC-type dipeptide/oligopeptide/nickel transport system ATPase subunit
MQYFCQWILSPLILISFETACGYSLSGTHGIYKSFQKTSWLKKTEVIALKNVTAVFPVGITALCGPSGSGKSTLSKIITGQYPPDKGELRQVGNGHLFTVYIDPLYYLSYDASKKVGSFFEPGIDSYNEAAFQSVSNILSIPSEKTVNSLLESQRKSFEILLAFYRAGFFNTGNTNELIEGDKGAGCIVGGPRGGVLVVDEYLDKDLTSVREQIFQKLRDLCKLSAEVQFQVIVVTHSKAVCKLCDSVVVIRNGVVYNQGPSEKVMKHLPAEYVVLP